jgi:hypothetical protein
MQGCTIAVKVTGSDRVEPYIQGEDARRAIVCVAPGSFPRAV